MVRRYQPDRAVSRADVLALLDLAIRAPSAGFSQGWHFLVLESAVDRARFWDATTSASDQPDQWLTSMQTAAVLVVALSDREAYLDRYAEADKGWTDRDTAHWPVPYWDVDTGMASLLMLLGAVDLDLGGCFFGVPPERHDTVRSTFGVPDRLGLVGVLSIGYPAPDRRSPSLRRGRRPVEEVASFGQFGQLG
ncbi:MAG: nitroreductase [Frankiales bacterium]|nr:nitroreductase [Frankiales bacterium]